MKPDIQSVINPFIRLALIGLLIISGCAPGPHRGSPVYPTGDPAPRSLATAAGDALILTRIKAKLFSDDLVDGEGMAISVRHGVVYLTGYAADDYDRRMAIDLIRNVDGVKRVDSRLRVRHGGTTFPPAGSRRVVDPPRVLNSD